MLQHDTTERDYLHRLEKERYALLNPLVNYLRWNNTEVVDDRWGHIGNDKLYDAGIEVRADYTWDKKIKEHDNGVWITTNRIEVLFCRRELDDLGIDIKLGDVIDLMGGKHEVLSVQPTSLIIGTQHDYLHLSVIIDTKQRLNV